MANAQDYDHLLKRVSGDVPMHNLEFRGSPATGQTFRRGALCSQTSAGTIQAGCADTAMPMWAINGAQDFDITDPSDDGNVEGGKVSLVPGTAGVEIYTTEYDTTASYARDAYLTAGTGDDAGKVTTSPAAYNTRIIVGQVSKGVQTGMYDTSVLYLWVMNIPKVKTS